MACFLFDRDLLRDITGAAEAGSSSSRSLVQVLAGGRVVKLLGGPRPPALRGLAGLFLSTPL